MTPEEKEELLEIRQVLSDTLLRMDRSYSNFNTDAKDEGFNDLAHAVQAMINIKGKLENLSLPRDVHKTDAGAYM